MLDSIIRLSEIHINQFSNNDNAQRDIRKNISQIINSTILGAYDKKLKAAAFDRMESLLQYHKITIPDFKEIKDFYIYGIIPISNDYTAYMTSNNHASLPDYIAQKISDSIFNDRLRDKEI